MIGLIAVTTAGRRAAARLEQAWPDTRGYPGPAAAAIRRAFAECDGIVCFLAVGATVRLIAPLLAAKAEDPGVVSVDEMLAFAVPVAGAHAGGANQLARAAADLLGATAVITTASDASGVPALDDFGASLGLRAEPGSQLAEVGAAVLSGERVTLSMDRTWPVPALPANVERTEGPERGVPAIVITDRRAAATAPMALYRPPSLVLGVGTSRGVSAAEIGALMDAALAEAALSAGSVVKVATVDLKRDEPGLLAAVGDRGWGLTTFPAAELADVAVPSPSEVVRTAVGTPSVAEAAALHAAGHGSVLAAPKRKSEHATVAIAQRAPCGRLALVGLGPGARDLMTGRSIAELRRASVVVGLRQYVDQVRDLLRPGTKVVATELGAEEQRAAAAVTHARAGHAVALVGSGDAGIYAMASPALEIADGSIEVVGAPGVTAALAAAAVLGAPLGHDHAAISLSDLHTPWAAIERRINAAAEADFVVCFYNPRSRERDRHLADALALLAPRRPAGTPVGLVADASGPGQRVTLTTIAEVDPDQADMRTLVVVGSSRTRVVAGRMVTPRGYRWREG